MKNPQYMDDEMPDEHEVGDIVEVLFEGEAEILAINEEGITVKIKHDGVVVSAAPEQVFRKIEGQTRAW